MKLVVGAIVTVVLAVLLFFQPAYASTVSVPNVLSVSPAIEQIFLTNGQNSATFQATVTNDSSAAITVGATVDDFTALDSTGSTLFLNNTKRLPAPHRLAHWMSPSLDTFTLAPHASGDVSVVIADATSMAPGGHYGAVLFKILDTDTNQHNGLAANTEVSLLVFLATHNPGKESIKLVPPQFPTLAASMPAMANLVFANAGDIQTMPRGLTIITDRTGHEVSRGIVNVESGLVLPATNRLYQIPLRTEQEHALPGIYHLTVYYRAGDSTQVLTYKKTFFYVSPLVITVLLVLLLALVFYGIRKLSRTVIHYSVKA